MRLRPRHGSKVTPSVWRSLVLLTRSTRWHVDALLVPPETMLRRRPMRQQIDRRNEQRKRSHKEEMGGKGNRSSHTEVAPNTRRARQLWAAVRQDKEENGRLAEAGVCPSLPLERSFLDSFQTTPLAGSRHTNTLALLTHSHTHTTHTLPVLSLQGSTYCTSSTGTNLSQRRARSREPLALQAPVLFS